MKVNTATLVKNCVSVFVKIEF